jgi:hypothetical protein
MNNEEKAQAYGQLLNHHTRISNMISEIKGRNIEPTKSDLKEIDHLKNEQIKIMNSINKLLS